MELMGLVDSTAIPGPRRDYSSGMSRMSRLGLGELTRPPLYGSGTPRSDGRPIDACAVIRAEGRRLLPEARVQEA